MKFFFPDCQDFIDPSFDFENETRSQLRVRQRDDVYPHEVFETPPYDGILVSKAIVDGIGGGKGKYSAAQRHRLLRVGVREFFRLNERPLETMGDCGAFSYIREERPPFSVQEVIDFYEGCGFDFGLSVDHVILGYKPALDNSLAGLDLVPSDWRLRQKITFELADEFLSTHKRRGCRFVPLGVAQGWSPNSYTTAVETLQSIGYNYIALGGMVPLKTHEILDCLKTVNSVRRECTGFHLLGVTRCDHVGIFNSFGVASFDSTSPLRRAFKDDKDNYYAMDRTYCAVRVPQIEGNNELQRRICVGEINQNQARELERACIRCLAQYEAGEGSLDQALTSLRAYERLFDGRTDHTSAYREVLQDRPWKNCGCEICAKIGIHVILFRGAERNRRRGFHNLFIFFNQLKAELKMLHNSSPNECRLNEQVCQNA